MKAEKPVSSPLRSFSPKPSKVSFDMLSEEQKTTLKGKEIGKAISALRYRMMCEAEL